ncbi:MAG: hypothetical protein IH820_16125, partial [Bacteroidetes bacterium]|nr:hypothetical protein [Bacteroidota bacterium]
MPLFSHPIVPRCGLLLVLLAVVVSSAAAQQAPVYEVHPDYTVRQWTAQDGLPTNEIRQIVPTSDGYLWLRTEAGPVRFDGRRFTAFNPTNTPSLQSGPAELVEGPPGYLWIVTIRTGLVLYHDGRFSRVETEGDPPRFRGIELVEG